MDFNIYGYLGMAFAFGILVLIVILLVVLIKQSFKTKHLKLTSQADAEFRKLAESSLRLHQELKDGQDKLLAEIAQLRTRMTAVEKLLREVE